MTTESEPALVPQPVCAKCGPGPALEGPWGIVWFCSGCGRSVRMGETARDVFMEQRRQEALAKKRSQKRSRTA